MYAEFLRHQGFVTIQVTSASDAVAVAPRADVVVTGIMLTGVTDGIELIGRLRADEQLVRTQHRQLRQRARLGLVDDQRHTR